ncbi:MATE family efflux transporter [Staphylococcus simulans]
MIKILTLSSSQLLAIILNFSIQIILAKLYGKDEAGIYFSIISLMNILSVVGLFGINKYYIFLKSKDNNIGTDVIQNMIQIFLFMNVSATFILVIISSVRFPEYLLFNVSSMFLIILTNGIAILTSIIQIDGKVQKVSLLQIIIPLLRVIGLLLGAIVLQKYFEGYSFIVIIISLIAIYFVFKSITRNLSFKKSKNDKRILDTFNHLIPYAALSITFILYTQGNTFYIGLLSSPENAAVFGLAYLFLNTIFIFPTAIYQKLLAHKLLNLMYNSQKEFKKLFSTLQELLILISSVIILVIYLASGLIITIFFGESYSDSIRILQLLSLVIPLRLLSISIGTVLSNDDYIRDRIKAEIVVTIINVISNIALINLIGLYGAIISVLITELILSFSLANVVKEKMKIPVNYSLYLPLLLVVIMVVIKLPMLYVIAIGSVIILFLIKPVLKRMRNI